MAVDYEVTYILRPGLEDNEADQRIATITDSLRAEGGEVVTSEKLGKKRLAYELRNVREGIYAVLRFRSEPEAAKELERQLGLNEDVLRALLVRLDKHALEAERAPKPPPPPQPAAAAPQA